MTSYVDWRSKQKMKSKYNAKKQKTPCVFCGEKHDSKKEAARCVELHQMQERGLIRDLRSQVKIQILPFTRYAESDPRMQNERHLTYTADFCYTEVASGKSIIEDVKGFKTKEYKIKRKIVKYMFCRKGECVFLET